MKEEHCCGLGPHVGCCRRVGAGCRDRQSGNHINEKTHRQPRIGAEDGAPRGRPANDGDPERPRKAAENDNRQATAEDNGRNFRFDMRSSVN